MGEQKNLFLAIGLSIAIIIVFQLLFPQQTQIKKTVSEVNEQIQPSTSIDDNKSAEWEKKLAKLEKNK